jgi:hypothetical protein
LLSGRLAFWLAGFLAGGLSGWRACFLVAGLLSGWLAFWPAGFLDSDAMAMAGLNYESLRWVF